MNSCMAERTKMKSEEENNKILLNETWERRLQNHTCLFNNPYVLSTCFLYGYNLVGVIMKYVWTYSTIIG